MADGVPTYYWDACMFYEWLGRENVPPERKSAVRQILQDNKAEKNLIVTSVITNLEVLPKKLTIADRLAEAKFLSIFDGVHFLDIEISRNILIRAREIRDYYFREANPKTGETYKMMDAADAIHLATALIYSVDEFHTRDDKRKGPKVPLVSLYQWAGEPAICNQYPLEIRSPASDQPMLELKGQADGQKKRPPKGD